LLSLLGLVLLSPGAAWALTDEEIFRDFRFQFITPGARATAMGGAFTSIADDATAAATNPAGLSSLSAPTAYVEYRSIDRDAESFGGEVGSPQWDPDTNLPDLPFFRLQAVSDPETVNEPTFLAFSWPFEFKRWGRRLTIAASRQVLAQHERSLPTSGAGVTEAAFALDGFPPAVVDDELQTYSIRSTVSGEISSEVIYWNASASFEVHKDFSVGVTLTYAELDMEATSLTRVLDPEGLLLDPSRPRLSGQPDADLFSSRISDSDTDFAYSIGVHWHPDSVFAGGTSPWQLGAVLHKGAHFSFAEIITLNEIPETTLTNEFIVPDRWVIGASYRTPQHWLFAVDVERVEYSDLLEGFRSGVNFLTGERLAEAFSGGDVDRVRYDVDDGRIFRAGAEYVRTLGGNKNNRLRFQAGYFRTPDDRIRMTRFDSGDPEINRVFLDAFPGNDEQDHFTAGIGFSWGDYAVQLAGSTSDQETQVVGSFSFELKRKRAPSPGGPGR
jgi:long-subunit fatty acid transport protein